MSIQVRNLRKGETLPPDLQAHGMAYLIPEWAWVVEPAPPTDPIAILTAPEPIPFALIVGGQVHSWLLLSRVVASSPLPETIPLTWFLEALPQVFDEARSRGCVGFLTLLADNRPEEVRLARIVAGMPGCKILPFQGSMGFGPLVGEEVTL